MPRLPTPEDLDAILPQTQCGLCGHGGCMPYAEALVYEQAAINLCPPGGVPVLHKIGNLMQQDPTSFENEMRVTAKPGLLAVIRENECIGCTKCIQACPVDAILGSAKTMHTVISNECTGCELCIAPCPVDCIDLIEISPAKTRITDEIDSTQTDRYRSRFLAHEQRIRRSTSVNNENEKQKNLLERKDYIKAALERVRNKKSGAA